MRLRRKNNIIISLLFCMLLFMGIGYALLSQNLNISGVVQSSGNWGVVITGIESKTTGTASVQDTSLDETKTIATLKTILLQPNDKVVYTITVENKGTIDAVRQNITKDSVENDVSFKVNGRDFCQNLRAGNSCQYEIVIEYLDTGSNQILIEEGTVIKNKFQAQYVQSTEDSGILSPEGFDEIVVDVPDYTLDDFGTIITYNPEKVEYDKDGYLIIPALNSEGKEIRATNSQSFARNLVEFVYDSDWYYIAVIKEKENVDEIKRIIEENMYFDFIMTQEEFIKHLKDNSLTYMKDFVVSVSTQYNEIIYSENSFEKTIEKVDFTNATNLTEIGDFTFYPYVIDDSGRGALKSVKFGNTVTNIGSYSFYRNMLTNITIPSSIEKIGDSAFSGNALSGELVIPNSITAIESFVFAYNKINKVTFEDTIEKPASITQIKTMAFADNQLIDNFIIPSSVNKIEDHAFVHNPKLLTLTIKRANSTGMTLNTNWNIKESSGSYKKYYEVIYAPN